MLPSSLQNTPLLSCSTLLAGRTDEPRLSTAVLFMKPHENFSLENIEDEIWEDVTIFDCLPYYQVSNMGRFKTKYREYYDSVGRYVHHKEIILSQYIDHKGYLKVGLYTAEGQYPFSAHQIIATVFVSNPDNKPEVNHKKGIKLDNRASELEWSTSSENQLHAFEWGLQLPQIGETNGMSKLTNREALEIFSSNEKSSVLAAKYNVVYTVIDRIRSGRLWSAITGKKHIPKFVSKNTALEIFNSPLSCSELAEKYNVRERTISNIKVGRQFSKVTGLFYPTKHRNKNKNEKKTT